MTLYTSMERVVFSSLFYFAVACSGRSSGTFLHPSSLNQVGPAEVYNRFNLDQTWNSKDGLENYWRHRVKRQQPIDQKAEFEAKIALLRRLGLIKPTSTIQQEPLQPTGTPNQLQPQPEAPRPQFAAPQPQPAAVQPQPLAPQPQPVAPQPQPTAPQPQPVAPQPQPAAPQPQPPQPQPAATQPQPQPAASQPQPVAPQPQPAAPQPPPDVPAIQPEIFNQQPAAPAPRPTTPYPQPATDAPNRQNPPQQPQPQPASKPQPTINPYLPVYPNRNYLNRMNKVNGEGPRPGPVPNQGITARPTTPKPIDDTTPVNRRQPAMNQAQPKPVQYPNQQYRPYETDPRSRFQPQYPDPRYNSPSYYNPQQPKSQYYYPRQPLNKQPVTAQAPLPAYRPPSGAYPTGSYPNQYYPRQHLPTAQIPQHGQSSPNVQAPTSNEALEQNQGQGKSPSYLPSSHKPAQQAPVIVDPYTGQEYYQVPGILPPFTDKLNQISLDLLNTSQSAEMPPFHPHYPQPTNGYPQPTNGYPQLARGMVDEMDDDAQTEALEDRLELLRLLNAQGNNFNPNSPELSTLLHHMMEQDELEFDDDGMLPPTINPTGTLTDATAYDYQPMGEYPTYSQAPYWYQGSPHNGDPQSPKSHNSMAREFPNGHHQGHTPGNPQGQNVGKPYHNHQGWPMHPSAPSIIASNAVTKTPPLTNQQAGIYPVNRNPAVTEPLPTIKPTPSAAELQEQRRQQQLKSRQRIEYLMMLKKKLERFAQLRKQLQQQKAAQSTPSTITNTNLRNPAATNPNQAMIGQSAIKQNQQTAQQQPANQPKLPNPSNSNQVPQSKPKAAAAAAAPNNPTESPIPQAKSNNEQKVQAALLNQQAATTPQIGTAGNFSAIAMVAEPGMSKSEVIGVIIGTLLGVVVVLVPLLCLLMRYRKHLKLKKKRFFPRPYSKRSEAARGSHDAMDTMVYSELGKQTLAFDSDGNGNGNQESDYLVSLPGNSINDNEAIYSNNFDNQASSNIMSLTSSKRADSVEISRLLTLRESEQKPKVPDASKRPALPSRGRMRETLQQHGSLQMLH